MKKILYSAVVVLITTFYAHAQDVVWHQDMRKASELAIAENKPLLMFFTGSDWCGWCIKLQKEVLKTKDFEQWASENVILVELDFPRRKQLDRDTQIQNYQMQQMFKVRGYPTVVFANPEKAADNKMNLEHLGSTGFVKGGSKKWLAVANSIVNRGNKS